MNDTLLEQIMSEAPAPRPPADLLRQLQAQIALPAAAAPWRNGATTVELPPFWRRWFPALAFTLFLLSCVVVIGFQANWLSQLKQDNERLRANAASLAPLRDDLAQKLKAQAQQDELARLRANAEEARRLRAEAESLRQLPRQIAQLARENQELTASLAARGGASTFLDEARQEEERRECVNHLKQLGLAARVWALDNSDKYPTSLVLMSNELNSVKILICPSDKSKARHASTPWAGFSDEMSSYQFLATGDKDEEFPQSVLSKCPIHHNYGLADGSVQMINPKKYREVKRDGRLYLENIPGASAP